MAGEGLRRATVIGWTGRGSKEHFGTSVRRILDSAGVGGRIATSGQALIVKGPDPPLVAAALKNAPGVEWVAVGMATKSFQDVGDAARLLARRYIRPGTRFNVLSSGGDGVAEADVGGIVVSAVVEEVRGSRVDLARPQVVLRATLSKSGGAVGVQTAKGPGGVPTGDNKVTCLVSGGMHSSVLCWMALLAGHRVNMVHAKVDAESERAVAKLYAELCTRVDPTAVALEVLIGGDPGRLANWAVKNSSRPVFVGSHAGCSSARWRSAGAEAPLYLAQEEWFQSQISGLSLIPHQALLRRTKGADAPLDTLRVGGVRAGVSGVLDGLRGQTKTGR